MARVCDGRLESRHGGDVYQRSLSFSLQNDRGVSLLEILVGIFGPSRPKFIEDTVIRWCSNLDLELSVRNPLSTLV